jgi:hypothetical protein
MVHDLKIIEFYVDSTKMENGQYKLEIKILTDSINFNMSDTDLTILKEKLFDTLQESKDFAETSIRSIYPNNKSSITFFQF